MTDPILALASTIDPERAARMRQELGASSAGSLGVALATAFPPLSPQREWQVAALAELRREGWGAPRTRSDRVTRLLAATGDLAHEELALSALRRAVWGEKARIALRELLPLELGGASVDVTARELADLADATIEVALAEASAFVEARYGTPRRADGRRSSLVAVGLGKLGGQELNAGSDVDLLFVYDSDDGGSELSLHEHWTRVVRRTVATLDVPTEDGLLWRTDLRLRPEGSRGPIVGSLAATERYYETWGRPWERAVMLRARAAAGDLALGAALEREVLVPFTYRREVDPTLATTLAELVERSRAELGGPDARDLKLGTGGIREVEFFVQALQLIWGGRERALRVRGTLPALSRLRSRGLVQEREARVITEGWLLLRSLEHRVQWQSGVQTHLLPESGHGREVLARSLGYGGADALDAALARARDRIAELFRSLLPTAPRPLSRHHALLALLEEGGPPLAAAAERTFGRAEVGEHLAALASRPDSLLGAATRDRHDAIADRVIDAIEGSADPEQAARSLRSFFRRFSAPAPYVALLAEDPRRLTRFVDVLGASAFVAEAVVASPETAEGILLGSGGVSDCRRVIEDELTAAEAAGGAVEDEGERRSEFVCALRKARRRVMVEVAVADLAGEIEMREATRRLADLADETLDRTLHLEFGGEPRGMALLALGKLGGRDLGYGSDLDVMFVFDAGQEGEDRMPELVRHAQRFVRLVSEPSSAGPGYEIDARLRPGGSRGLLVTSLRAFARYHRVRFPGESEPAGGPAVHAAGADWERQALLRARVCAGDPAVGARAIAIAHVAAYEGGAPAVEELHRLRLRMQHELAHERPGRYDLKTGRGGLLDVEFAVQWLQMRHGHDRRLRTTDTAEALEALHALGYLARPAFESLREGYAFLRRLEQRIHVVHGASATAIDERAPGLTELARRMGLHRVTREGSPRDALLARYRGVTSDVRATYLAALGLPAE